MPLTCPSCGKASEVPSDLCPACDAPLGALAGKATRPWGPGGKGEPAPDPADLLEPGAMLGGYRIEGLLGHGGMGVVYRAMQDSLGRPVALKVLARHLAEDESFVRRFDREASALAALNHPNIVAIFDKGASEGRFYFAMELVDGVSLRRVLTEKALSPAEALSAMPDLCSALEYAHGRGVLHRDIKPENLLVARDGRIKIADFGLARLTGERASGELTRTRTVMGTRDYMAPEARQTARQADHRADLYALGVVLYEMLTGELPIGHFAPPSEKCGVDAQVDAVVLKALAADPDRRWQRASEIAEALSRAPVEGSGRGMAQAQALAGLERPSVLAVTPAPREATPVPAEASAPAPARRPGSVLGRRPGEARRRWKARVGALSFLGLALLGFLGILVALSPGHRVILAVPLGLAALMASAAWWWKRPRG